MKRKMKYRKTANDKFNKKLAITVLSITLVAVLLVSTFAWYQSQVTLNGSKFSTGTIDFIATGYDENGQHVTTILQQDKDSAGYNKVNAPLFSKNEWDVNRTDTAYIAVEKTGSLDMEYKITFSAAGDVEYLGGFWYSLTDITDDMPLVDGEPDLQGYISNGNPAKDESKGYSMATMERYATVGSIKSTDSTAKRFYRLDYGMKKSAITAEYAGMTVEIIPKIFVTQIGALESDEDYGYIHNCSTVADIEKARDSALPGDSIKLMNNITYEGDLVFNKAVNILTNNFVLEVQGNLVYDFVSSKPVTFNVTGNGAMKVTSPEEGVGGNFTVTAPGSDVTFVGSNNAAGDIVVADKLTVNATRTYGSAGATFNNVRILEAATYLRATVYVNSDTRITVTENTTISAIEAVAKSSNIEISNAGTINTVALSAMNVIAQQLSSPQIYITNMGYIVDPIELPSWSTKFSVVSENPLTCEGNTRIIQTVTGNNMSVVGSGNFTVADIEKESTDTLVSQVGNSDAELIIYYQDYTDNGEQVTATIKSILEKYFRDNGRNASSAMQDIRRLDIISIGDKAITNDDITFIKSEQLQSLLYLDMSRANVTDTSTGTVNKLCDNAFAGFTRFSTFILPQNLEKIGNGALSGLSYNDIILIPGSVTEFGEEWFKDNNYVAFAASTPALEAYNATNGLAGIKAIFVEEYYVDSYKTAYKKHEDIIFPMAEKDDNGLNFVRQIPGSKDWEIVCYIGNASDSINIGDGIKVDNNLITVTRIGAGAYSSALSNGQTVISFADTIKTIGEKAFYNTQITKVDHWSTSLETISASAFEECTYLAGDIVLPDSVKTIEKRAFYHCTKITGVNTGGITSVKDSALSGCTSLVWVEMPNVVELIQSDGSIYSGMFYGDSKLTSVKLPSLEKTEGIIFNNCKNIVEAIFGSSGYTEAAIGGYTSFHTPNSSTFDNLKLYFDMTDVSEVTVNNITNKIYPLGEKYGEYKVNGYNVGEFIVSDKLNDDGSVTVITSNQNKFTGTLNLPETWNGKDVTNIYKGAFRNNAFSGVTLVFPDTLEVIGEYAFYNKTGITAVSSWGDSLKAIEKHAFYGSTNLAGNIVLPDSLETIGANAFYNCKSITSLNTGGATEVGTYAFYSCAELVTAELPNVEYIGDHASGQNYLFGNCNMLVSAKLPKLEGVQGGYMFSNCSNIKEVWMGANVDKPTLGSSVFNGVSSANKKNIKIYVPSDLVDTYKSANVASSANQIYRDDGIKVGDNVVNGYNIGNYIIVPNGVDTATLVTTTLNFSGDTILPDTLGGYKITNIGPYAMCNQTFTNVNLKMGTYVTEIEKYAFNNIATGLVEVDLANTKVVGARAFEKCSAMTLLVANKLETISGTYAFNNCSSLTTLNLPKLVTASGFSFISCKKIVTISVPNLETTGQYEFSGCSALTSIYFENIKSFGGYNFQNCTLLEQVIINKTINSTSDVPTGAANNFTDAKNTVIMVPTLYMSYYTNSQGMWNNRLVVSYDYSATDAAGNSYIIDLDGTECIIKYFIGNGALTSVTLPDALNVDGVVRTVVGLRSGAFESVDATLTAITLPAGMYDFGPSSLTELPLLNTISVDAANRFYSAVDGVLFSKDGGMLVKYPVGKTDAAYSVADNVFAIGEYAFENCTNLDSITFGTNLTVIDSTAFSGAEITNVIFTGDVPPLLMGTAVFDTTVDEFSMTVPEDGTNTYLRAMNFAKYAEFINEGFGIPEDGEMNKLPWSTASASVEYASLPPESTDVDPKEEDETEPPPEDPKI